MQEIIIFVIWITVGLIAATKLPRPSASHFELKRRQSVGEDRAEIELRQEKQRPLLEAFFAALEALLLAIAITWTIWVFGFVIGLALTLLLLLALKVMSDMPWLNRLAADFEASHHQSFVAISQKFSTVLQPLVKKQSEHPELSKFDSRHELKEMLKRDEKLEADEKDRLMRTLSFSEKQVRDVMTPIEKMVTVKDSATVGPLLLDELHKSGEQAFLVYGKKDQPAGILLMTDLVPLKKDATTASKLMRPEICYVRSDAALDYALQAFLRTRQQLFIVVDASGHIVGSISLEQVMESLLGRTIGGSGDDLHDRSAVAERHPGITE